MAPRSRPLATVVGGLVLMGSLTACAHGASGARRASLSSTTTTAADSARALVVKPPTPSQSEPKALSPLPTVPR